SGGKRVAHKSSGNWPRSMWSSQEISWFDTITSYPWPRSWPIVGLPRRFGDGENAPLRSDPRHPFARDDKGFIGTRPGRHGDRDPFEWRAAVAAELELSTGRDRDRDPRNDLGDFLVVAKLAPHPPTSRNEVPDLLDRPMGDGLGHGIRGQPKGG